MTKNRRPSVERLREVLEYDPETGNLVWRNSKGAGKGGRKAGGTCKTRGYSYVSVDYCRMLAHRVAWAMYYGKWPEEEVEIDHIDGVKDNNSIDNLRLCNHMENTRNTRIRTNNTSGYKGASYVKSRDKWEACINYKGRKRFLGYYDTPEEAHEAYCKAANSLHGEFARTA